MSVRLRRPWEDPEADDLAAVVADVLGGDHGEQRERELGWPGIGIPEDRGGSGGSLLDLAVVLEEIGAAVSPSGLGGAAVLGSVLLAAPRSEPVDRLLAAVAAGARVAWPVSLRPASAEPRMVTDGAVRAAPMLVHGGTDSELVVLPTATASGGGVLVLSTALPGVTLEEAHSHDLSRPYSQLTAAVPEADAVLVDGPAAARSFRSMVALAATLDSLGAARSALSRTLDYAASREQFGRPIGSFQAYQHRCADAWLALRLAQVGCWDALRSMPDGAQVTTHSTAACTYVCGEAVQLHGAIGFSWETGLHHRLKRTKINELATTCWSREPGRALSEFLHRRAEPAGLVAGEGA